MSQAELKTQVATQTGVAFSIPNVMDQGQGSLPVPLGTGSGIVPASATTEVSTVAPGAQHTAEVVVPVWMMPEQQRSIEAAVEQFFTLITANPVDAKLVNSIDVIGKQGEASMTPAMTLYNVKVGEALGNIFAEDAGMGKTLLQIKMELDRINPSMVKNKPVPRRFLSWLFPLIRRLPNGEEIMRDIYASRETVGSTVTGLKEGLYAERDKIQTFKGEIEVIYDRVVNADRQDEADTYFGDLLLKRVDAFRVGLKDPKAVANMEEFQGALQRRTNFIRERQVLNKQFFDGAIAFMRNTRMQLEALGYYASLEQSILANLGLKAATQGVARSAIITQQLGGAISQTVADTAAEQLEVGTLLMKQQKSTMLDLIKLEQACNDSDTLFERVKGHNRQLIVEGAETGKRIQAVLDKNRQRIELGHSAMAKKEGRV